MRRLLWGECRGGACDRNFFRCVRERRKGGEQFSPSHAHACMQEEMREKRRRGGEISPPPYAGTHAYEKRRKGEGTMRRCLTAR